MEPAILDLLYDNFFRDEPMNRAVGLVGTAEDQRSPILDGYVSGVLGEGLSVVAVDADTGEIVGEIIVGISCIMQGNIFV